jgi:hypothetical protein
MSWGVVPGSGESARQATASCCAVELSEKPLRGQEAFLPPAKLNWRSSSPKFGDYSCGRAIALGQSDRQGVEAEPLPPDQVQVRNLLGDQYATLHEHPMNWPVEVRWAGSVGHVRRGSVQRKHAHLEIDQCVGQIKRQVGVLAVLRRVGVLAVPTRVETHHGMWSERPHLGDHVRSRNLLAGLPLDRDNDPLADESVSLMESPPGMK